MRCLFMICLLFILGIGGFIVFVYSGIYDVSALSEDNGIVQWIATSTRKNSIESHIKDIDVPSLQGSKMVRPGARAYNEMCAGCHSAPGAPPSPLRQGLSPRPPRLARIAQYIDPAKAFWVIKNGIKMTGMPAWGPTHNDHELWNIVAFLRELPRLDPEQYRALIKPGTNKINEATPPTPGLL